MNAKHDKSQRNLAILIYMGWACQLAGVLLTFGSLVGFWGGAALGGALFLVFGMALAGWANNLSQIIDLKKRLSALEEPSAKSGNDEAESGRSGD